MTILLVNSNSRFIPLADESVNCIVTSPPYYGLRDYGTGQWVGGDSACDHLAPPRGGRGEKSTKQVTSSGTQDYQYTGTCGKCGAVRVDHQIGQEQTPEEYVESLLQVFRECWRVLRKDGTLWLNLGDSYAGSGVNDGSKNPGLSKAAARGDVKTKTRPNTKVKGIKSKDLIGIPWMVAFALRADGWYLRNEIIWYKPNPMPESVTDRCTRAHEQMFLLSKSRKYYFDADAIKEPSKQPEDNRGERGNRKRFPTDKISGIRGPGVYPMANKRDVWKVTTAPYPGSHFATYPPDLIEPCIKAGCPEGGVVLDPFNGSGTTVWVARNLGRDGVGLDLSLEYIQNEAKTRLGLNVLEAWTNGLQADSSVADLPLFQNVEA